MKWNLTTFFGGLAAAATAALAVPGLPEQFVVPLRLTAAIAIALLGYHAKNENNSSGNTPLTLLICLCTAALLLTTGCRVGGLGVQVSNPTFGSVGITLDGGMIGRGRLQTSVPETHGTNAVAPLSR